MRGCSARFAPDAGTWTPQQLAGALLALSAVSFWVASAFRFGLTLAPLAVTVFGLSITLRGGRSGDIAYHVSVLALLAIAILLLPGRRLSR